MCAGFELEQMKKRQSGFSLIEVLVATVIMAIGILGIAGLQVVSLQQNRSSLLRSEAAQLGNDIMDRIRVNPGEKYWPVEYTDAPKSDAKNCKELECNTGEMKDYDIALWKCMINPNDSAGAAYPICAALLLTFGKLSSLPEGDAEIKADYDDKLGTVTTVRVRWVDDKVGTKRNITLVSRTDAETKR
jgi:type IV pilus modification protein PilV